MRLTSWLFVLVAVLLAVAPLHAQPRRGVAPQFGSVQATAEVASLNVEAGGADRNTIPGSGCSGFISNAAPTAVVSFGGGGPLSIYATSGTDTTLLVADPGGRWHCSDDANGSNPGLTFATAAEGDYTVWVGTFSPDAAGTAARLFTVQGSPRW